MRLQIQARICSASGRCYNAQLLPASRLFRDQEFRMAPSNNSENLKVT